MNGPGNSRHFLLVGNGPYVNRGCEAIVRGTVEILRREFGADTRFTVGSFGHRRLVLEQAAAETDPGIAHVALEWSIDRWSAGWWRYQALKLRHPLSHVRFRMLDPFMETAVAALEIGGDNYTLDYGLPESRPALDRHIQRSRLPVVLWGASVGPFDAAPPDFQKGLFEHLASLRAIYVREPISLAYLRARGLANVFPTCDPAFAMTERKPAGSRIGAPLPADAIGLNFSPLMARYVTGGDRDRWIALCADIVRSIAASTTQPLLLIPHVTSDTPAADDFVLLETVAQRLGELRGRVRCLPGTLSAAELKWVIARCSVFAGARTHATIAALSSGVPTLSFAYSPKAFGINQDLFGSTAYCLAPGELTSFGRVAQRLTALLAEAPRIRNHLTAKMPEILNRAFAAGPLLRERLGLHDVKRVEP